MTALTSSTRPFVHGSGYTKLIGATVLALVAWFPLYWRLQPFSEWVVGVLPIEPGSHLAEFVVAAAGILSVGFLFSASFA